MDCVFCQIIAGGMDPRLHVFEDEHVMALISRRQKPGNHGHALLVPKPHVPNIYELPEALNAPLMSALSLLARAVKSAFSADGIHIRQNNEPVAGQDVFHLHFHVVPRFLRDGFEAATYEALPLETRRALAARLKAAVSKEHQSQA